MSMTKKDFRHGIKTSMDTAALDKRMSERKNDLNAEMKTEREMDTVESDEAENG